MQHDFDEAYWEQHWQAHPARGPGSMRTNPPNPYLAREVEDLRPGTALDAGCGAGAEARWLAEHGWQVTAADIAAEALAGAAERAAASGADRVEWIQADLGVWEPEARFDLVTTHYAHPAMPQLEFYDRIAGWVAPGGTLLIVGHLHGHDGHGHDEHGHDEHGPPAEASVTAAAVAGRLEATDWEVVTAEEAQRGLPAPGGREVTLYDVVVRATRRR